MHPYIPMYIYIYIYIYIYALYVMSFKLKLACRLRAMLPLTPVYIHIILCSSFHGRSILLFIGSPLMHELYYVCQMYTFTLLIAWVV